MVGNFFRAGLLETDLVLAATLKNEIIRQACSLSLIASEGFMSKSVLEAQASVLTNKYAEGFPGKRYYAGSEFVDEVEELAVSRAKRLFGCRFANVRPYSGRQMNQAVLQALLSSDDTIMGLDLKCGGHLTHGSSVNLSGMHLNVVTYGVNARSGLIDMNEVLNCALRHKPKLIFAAADAYPRTPNWDYFRRLADLIDAYLLADISHIAGLVAAGEQPSPFPYCHVVTSTTHDSLRGPIGGMVLTDDEHISEKVDAAVFSDFQDSPMMHTIAAKATALWEADSDSFKAWAKAVVLNAKALCGSLSQRGLRVLTGGTDNHIVVIDLRDSGITGKDVELALSRCFVLTNRSALPFDPLPADLASGLRLGSCACTTRGMGEAEMATAARIVADVIKVKADFGLVSRELEARARADVLALADAFPVLYTGISVAASGVW
ncbi:MAG: serine hydroxymethyltransferase [Candidatus Hodgkinia cicadicola]